MEKITRRQMLGSVSTLLLSVSPARHLLAAEASSQFVAVRVWPASVYTRITIETTLPLKYSSFPLNNPERLVIDIGNAKLNEVLKTLPAKVLDRDPYLKQIRISQYTPDLIRIVLDLKTLVDPQIFTLSPVENFKNRLVIDLYPAVVNTVDDDPLMTLLQDYRHGDILSDGTTTPNARTNIPNNRVPLPDPEPLTDELGDKIKDILKQQKDTEKTNEKQSNKQSKKRKIIVVLDPGHGGEDPGAVGSSGLYEKDVVLAIARDCKKKLESKGYLVYLTRSEDVSIPLVVRVAKAREHQADIFISIHADSFYTPIPRGTGIFMRGINQASDEMVRYLEKTQNNADAIGGFQRVGNKKMMDTSKLNLMQTQTNKHSLKLGKALLQQFSKINKMHKHYVERANYIVLSAPDIPSILVETAFISNPEEEKLLASSSFRSKCAQAIADGIQTYVNQTPALKKLT